MGVAISASLLPPAVNCGLFWSVSLTKYVYGEETVENSLVGHQGVLDHKTNMTVGGYQARYYQDDLAMEFFALGLVSLTLTLINILCIIITGVLILRLKEVTANKVPQKSKISDFWRTDVKAHRDYYKAFKKEEVGERQAISTLNFDDVDDEGNFDLNTEIL